MNGNIFTLSILITSILVFAGMYAYHMKYLKIRHIEYGAMVVIPAFILVNIPVTTYYDPLGDLHDNVQFSIDSGRFDLAIQLYSEIIEEYPNDEKAWHEKGKLLNRFEKCEESTSHYERYVAKFPESSRAHEGYEISRKICS